MSADPRPDGALAGARFAPDRPARILDLDLDFFLDRVARRARGGGRLDDRSHATWPETATRRVLESRLRLNTARPTPGFIVTHHRDAFLLWRDLIARGVLVPPLSVTHVDAHADLGMSNDGHRYIMGDLLHQAVAQRANPADIKLRSGNYLLFAAACRWLAALTYVTHHRRYRGGVLRHDDRTPCHFRANDADSGWLELRRCDPNTLTFAPSLIAGYGVSETVPTAVEPAIRFETIPWWHYRAAEPFDLVVVAWSPDYTPPCADALLDVIVTYLAVEPC